MSAQYPIAKERDLPEGAVFHRCALQVNPHDYSGTFRGQELSGDAHQHAKAIVDKAVEIGISVLAITNHNDVRGVAAFQDAASDHGVTIFPGFELSSSEGIHILCIYPPDTDEERLGRFLGEFGIRETVPSSKPSTASFGEVLEKVREQGGITVAAHVVNDKGLFSVLTGQPRIHAWRNENLLAIQIPGSVEDLPQNVRKIVENREPEYQRAHAASVNLAVATVNAKDVVKPEDLADPSATTWIKMSEVGVEGLRQAFLDPGSRIRLNSDPEPQDHAELVKLGWEGGFLDGAVIQLNPNLNVLVGGRGAGKSTVIESLRYVLGLDPIGEEALKGHTGIVSQVLKSGTKISLSVCSHRPAKRDYLIERTVPNPPVVRGEDGQVLNLMPEDILPNVEVYGQHEISELARSRSKLTRLLNRFVERDQSLSRRKAEVRRKLGQTRRSILDVQKELAEIEERLATLPGLEETLERFQEAGLEERLRERSLLVREERILDSIPERLEPFREYLEGIRQETPIDRLFLSPRALQDLPGKGILEEADQILKSLSNEIDGVVQILGNSLEKAQEGVNLIRSNWNKRKREVQRRYEALLRELQQSAVDGEEFIQLRREIESLRPLRERRSLLRRLEKEHLTRRRELLTDWEDLKAHEFRLLDRAARKVGSQLRNRVQVEVTAAGNREPLVKLLRSVVGGQLSNTIEKLRGLDSLSLVDLANSCRNGVKDLRAKYSLTPMQARNIAESEPEVFMLIEELELPPTTAIHLNTARPREAPSWQVLEDLSTGQKATAVLLLLLLESEAPLIVDQPEDDLDNRFITEGVVPRMRKEKRRRQFIFSTHNANILVLGDAEQILGLTAVGEAGKGKARIMREHMGSIDNQTVRTLVETLLEGGKTAFETRRLKYGF